MKISEFPTVPLEHKKIVSGYTDGGPPTEGQRGQDDAVTQALKIAGDMGRVAAYRPAKCAVAKMIFHTKGPNHEIYVSVLSKRS